MKKFFHLFFIFILFVIISALLFIAYLSFRYINWEREFERSLNSSYIIDEDTAKKTALVEKTLQFVLSGDDVSFLELDVAEMGAVIYTTLNSYLGDDVKIERIYIQAFDSKWVIYSKIGYKRFSLWISADVNKDNVQSIQLYTTEIKVGPFDISSISDLAVKINKGIGEAVVTLNENGFVGRYLENIELRENSIILKGSRY